MIRAIRAASFLFAAVPAALVAQDPATSVRTAPSAPAAATIPLSIVHKGSLRRFAVEIAATPAEQERGLMFRMAMPADRGMIFPMDPPRPASFWMKNTYIPLDIIFIGPDRKIVRIAADARPLSLDLIDCPEQVSAVLELNGGRARALGLGVGDEVRW